MNVKLIGVTPDVKNYGLYFRVSIRTMKIRSLDFLDTVLNMNMVSLWTEFYDLGIETTRIIMDQILRHQPFTFKFSQRFQAVLCWQIKFLYLFCVKIRESSELYYDIVLPANKVEIKIRRHFDGMVLYQSMLDVWSQGWRRFALTGCSPFTYWFVAFWIITSICVLHMELREHMDDTHMKCLVNSSKSFRTRLEMTYKIIDNALKRTLSKICKHVFGIISLVCESERGKQDH